MPGARRYRIAGATIAISSPGVPLAGELNEEYLPFLDPEGAGGGSDDLAIEAALGAPHLPADARPLMEGGEAWTAHASGDSLLIAPHAAAGQSGPEWLAQLHPGRRRVTLTCAASLLVGEGCGRRLAAPIHYPLDQLLLALALADEALIVHAAAVEMGGRALVLAGVSGAGKTTIARLCAAAGRPVLADDRVILRRSPRGWLAWGTPWPGEGRFAENRGLPLAAVAFLARGGENRLLPLTAAALARRLLPLATIPWFDPPARARSLDLLAGLAAAVPAHELAFRPDAGAERALAAAFTVAG